MNEVYRLADLLVVPSVWEEAFGRVVVEAHAAGLLVDDFSNPHAWESRLKEIAADPSCLDPNRSLLEDNAQRFSPDVAVRRASITGG